MVNCTKYGVVVEKVFGELELLQEGEGPCQTADLSSDVVVSRASKIFSFNHRTRILKNLGLTSSPLFQDFSISN